MSVTLAVRTATAALVAPLRRSIHCPSLSFLFGKVVLMTHFIAAIALLALAKPMTCCHLPALFGMDRSLFFSLSERLEFDMEICTFRWEKFLVNG